MKELVGTELSKMIPDWAVQFEGACGCKDMAAKMDRWGAEGCEARRAQIVTHLMQQSDRLIPAFRLVPDAVKRSVASGMLSKAITNAKRP